MKPAIKVNEFVRLEDGIIAKCIEVEKSLMSPFYIFDTVVQFNEQGGGFSGVFEYEIMEDISCKSFDIVDLLESGDIVHINNYIGVVKTNGTKIVISTTAAATYFIYDKSIKHWLDQYYWKKCKPRIITKIISHQFLERHAYIVGGVEISGKKE